MTDETAKPDGQDPERRDYERLVMPVLSVVLAVDIGGTVYKTINWSMGGLLLDSYDGPLSAGALVSINGIGTDELPIRKVTVRARVIRADEESGFLALTFLGLDTPAYDFIKTAISGRSEADQPD